MAFGLKKQTTQADSATAATVQLTDDPNYAAAVERLSALKAEFLELDRKINHAVEISETKDGISQEAATMIMGGEVAIRERTEKQDTTELRNRRSIISEAIGAQEQIERRLRSEISGRICDALRPQYEAILQRIAAAILEARAACLDEFRFRAHLANKDISFAGHLPPLPMQPSGPLGSELEATENLDRWLAELKAQYPQVAKSAGVEKISA